MNIEDRYRLVNENIEKALLKNQRKRSDVKLMAVTKTQTPETINRVLDFGIDLIGENRVQELLDKIPAINNKFSIHFIGQLQKNKVKYIIDKVSLIHSVDRVNLADEIERCAKNKNLIMPVLLQVNISDESTKAGVNEDALLPLLEYCIALDHVQPVGLMTVARPVEDPELNRPAFAQMHELLDKCSYIDSEMKQLSMGMSNDYTVAIEEGASIIRVGSALFGERTYINI